MHYVGVSWATGKQFDASWDRGDTFKFGLGRGQVIQGWDQGVAGMKVGGRRRITIPPDLAYGSAAPAAPSAPTRRSSSSWTSSACARCSRALFLSRAGRWWRFEPGG